MAGIKISGLPAATSVATADLIPIVQGGVTKKATAEMVVDLISDVQSARLATTAALTATYDNGTAGVGATLTNSGAFAALSIDSVATVVGDRILVKDQASTFENGIYSVTVVGDGVSVNWVLTRTTDYDEPDEITPGDTFTVAAGTVNATTQWIQTATVAVIGTDAITFASNIVAGIGLSKTNNTIRIAATPSAGVLLRGNGTNWAASTLTFPDTIAVNTIPYANAANNIGPLAPALSSVLVSSAASTGVPTWVGPLTNGQVVIGSTGATPVAASLTAGTGISIGTGAGSITINATGAGVAWVEATGATQQIAVNTYYIADNGGGVTFTLPATAAVGDTFGIVGKAGLWVIDQDAAGQQIIIGSTSSTIGAAGSATATNAADSVVFVCTTQDLIWTSVGAPQGAIVLA